MSCSQRSSGPTNDAVVIIDGDCRVSHFNAAAEIIWGLDRAAVLGSDVGCLGLKDLLQQPVAHPASGQVNGGGTSPGRRSEITIARQDGSRIRAALSLSHVAAGGQSRIIAFVRDITIEFEQRARLSLLTSVADRTNRAVVVTDRDRRIVYTNAAFTTMFGYAPDEAKGRLANELLVGRNTDRGTLARLRRWIGVDSGGEEDVLAYDRNGDEIWISANVKAFRNARGRVKYLFALLSDITETRQLRSLQPADHERAGR